MEYKFNHFNFNVKNLDEITKLSDSKRFAAKKRRTALLQ